MKKISDTSGRNRRCAMFVTSAISRCWVEIQKWESNMGCDSNSALHETPQLSGGVSKSRWKKVRDVHTLMASASSDCGEPIGEYLCPTCPHFMLFSLRTAIDIGADPNDRGYSSAHMSWQSRLHSTCGAVVGACCWLLMMLSSSPVRARARPTNL